MKLQACLVALVCYVGGAAARDSLAVVGWPANQDGSAYLRRSITDLDKERGPQWDLYIQALNVMYNKNSDDPDSFFQLASLHGRPFMEWGHTGGQRGDNWLGYCPHGEDIFLIWHRPYVTLFEQVLNDAAHDIAQTYPDQVRQRYMDAADKLRSPYWDWGFDQAVPPVTVPSTVRVTTPTGPQDVYNPLYSFKYPQKAINGAYGSFDNNRATSRCPAPRSYPATANANLRRLNLKQWVYDTFSRNSQFFYFATTASRGESFESIHDAIHNEAACGMQFQAPPLSGFDPLFFLHHTNVDRMWAYWEALHANAKTLDRSYRGASRWSSPTGATINSDTQLSPFFKGDFSWHTVDSVTDIRTFGYAYEGLEYWNKTDDQMRQDSIAILNRLYGNNGRSARRDESSSSNETVTTQGAYKRYFAHISVDRAEVPIRPCNVQLELGGKFAGTLYVMPLPETGSANTAVSLDAAIKTLGLKVGKGVESIKELQKKLNVKLTKIDGTPLDTSAVKSLKIEIEESLVQPPKSIYELPKFDTTEKHVAYTDGKTTNV